MTTRFAYRNFPEPRLDPPDDDPNSCALCGQELAVDADEEGVQVWCSNPYCPHVICGDCDGSGIRYDDPPTGQPRADIPCPECSGMGWTAR